MLHEKSQQPQKSCTNDSYQNHKSLPLAEFDWPFQAKLDENNRWVKPSKCMPWDELAEACYHGLSEKRGRPAKDARLVIGAVIIKHKLCLSDRGAVAQIQEDPFLLYFVGLPGYQTESPFVPSLFVEIRKRMRQPMFNAFQGAIIDAIEDGKPKEKTKVRKKAAHDDTGPPSGSGGTIDEEDEKRQGKPILPRIFFGLCKSVVAAVFAAVFSTPNRWLQTRRSWVLPVGGVIPFQLASTR